MESLRNEPVSFGTSPQGGSSPTIINTPGGSGIGDGGALSTIALLSLLGGNGFGNRNGYDCTSMNQIADARRDITKSEGDIKEAFNAGLHRSQIENAAHFTNLLNRSCDEEKEAMKAGHASEIRALESKADLLANQNANTISIKDDIKDFRFEVSTKFCETNRNIDDKFCHLEHKIEKGFDRLAVAELEKENRILRERLEANRDREQSRDINHIEKAVEKILCGLRNIPAPTGQVPNVLSGCC